MGEIEREAARKCFNPYYFPEKKKKDAQFDLE